MDLYELSIREAIGLLGKKKISSAELFKSCRERIETFDKKLNAFITPLSYFEDDIKNGNLAGIPVAYKDIFNTKGIKTTAASRVLEKYIPSYDATVVSRMKSAGALTIGKTNLDAWAHGSSGENSDFGPTFNPWNNEYVPGGSSSGSAVAVASGMCLASFGTDTGGSIRLPASFCNLVGLKPTYGRVSRYGIIAMASSHDSIGHFTKTVYDGALILNITAGKDDFDGTTSPSAVSDYTLGIDKGVKGLRIGIPKEYFSKGIDVNIRESINSVLKKYEELGAKIIEISLPHTEYALSVYYIIQPSEVSSNLARFDGIRYGNDRTSFSDEAKRRIMLGTYTLSSGYYDAYYLKAMKVRTLLRKDFEDAFSKTDVIIAPVSPVMPFKLGEKSDDPMAMYLSDVYTVTMNLTGNPGLSVPCGFIHNLPVGFQIIGPHFSEKLLFQVGYAYQEVTDWHKRTPVL